VLVPGLAVVALWVWWAVVEGGYTLATRGPSTLIAVGLLVAVVAGLGPSRLRLSPTAAAALGLLGAFAAWSYLSISWAPDREAALDGSNRTLLYLVLFALFALLPWRAWTALAVAGALATVTGALAVVTLVRLGGDGAASLFLDGRLDFPLGYVNATAAFFTVGALLSIALAARRELPVWARAALSGCAAACLQAAVLCASRGWLFALPVVALGAVALVPGRLRLLIWTVPPALACAAVLGRLLDVFERWDAAPAGAADAALGSAAGAVTGPALAACGAAVAAGVGLALADRRVELAPLTTRNAGRVVAAVATVAACAGAVAALVAVDGRPDRAIADYWERSQTYQAAEPGSSRFALAGSNRPDFWRVSIDAWAQRPLTGLGQDNWGAYYLLERRSGEQPRWTHSVELRLLAHTGLVGLALFAGFVVLAAVAALRGRRRLEPATAAAGAIALLPGLVWLVHGSVDWFWEVPALAGPAFALLGLATALGAGERRVVVPRVLVGALAVALAAAAVAVSASYLSDRERRAASESWRADPAAALDRLRRAEGLDPFTSGPALSAGLIEIQRRRPLAARAWLGRALARDPDNWFLWLARGLAASEAGDRPAALADYRRAVELDPRGPLARAALRRERSGRPLSAEAVFDRIRRDAAG